jgi:hypothetical protein
MDDMMKNALFGHHYVASCLMLALTFCKKKIKKIMSLNLKETSIPPHFMLGLAVLLFV